MNEMSATIADLAHALSKAQAEMKPAAFNATNPFLKNKYADLGAVIEASRTVLAKNGLAVSQLTSGDGDNIGVTTVLMHSSGEWLSSTITLPVGEEKGKSQAQVAGSIISYLRRYSLASILGMYAEEDTDGHASNGKAAQVQAQAEQPKQEVTSTNKRPYLPAVVRMGVQEKAKKHSKAGAPNEAQIKLLRYGLELCFAGDANSDDKRHVLLGYLTGDASTKAITGPMFKAIVEDWLKMTKDSGGDYTIDPMAVKEAQSIVSAALVEEGQKTLAV